MNPLTSEWVEKAEADFDLALLAMGTTSRPNYDNVCYLCQQCVEKYLKARLQEAKLPIRKTHDLELLLDAIEPIEPLWEPLRNNLDFLNTSATGVRYPGVITTKDVAERALQICTEVRRLVRESLHLTI